MTTEGETEEDESLCFNGSSGRTYQYEARRYVYRMLIPMLKNELRPEESGGWMFGGITQEPDLRRLRKAIKAVIKEMQRKTGDP